MIMNIYSDLPQEEQRVLQIIPIHQKGEKGEALAQVNGFILYLRRPEEYSGLTTEAESEEYFDAFDKLVLKVVKNEYSGGCEVKRDYKIIERISTVVNLILGRERRSVTFQLSPTLGKLKDRDEVSFSGKQKVPCFTMDIYLRSWNVKDSIDFRQDVDDSLKDLQEMATKAEGTRVSSWLTRLRKSYPHLHFALQEVSLE